MDIIKWCNENQGFISALLASLSLISSIIAICISISVAKLPYKKKLLISRSFDYLVMQHAQTGEVLMPLNGMTISVLNVGAIPINIHYLGLGIKVPFKSMQKIISIKEDNYHSKILNISEQDSVECGLDVLKDCIKRFKNYDMIYAIAIEAEGKIYKRRISSVKNFKKTLKQ